MSVRSSVPLYVLTLELLICIWNKEELPDQWKESIIVSSQTKGDKTD
jgi:hypothetical protein